MSGERSAAGTVIVLGAGMVGTATALALQARGKDVLLIDRSEPGSKVSYGNAGIIQGEAREPYPLPRDVATLWGIASGQDNSVAWTVRGVLHSTPALLSYWWHSAAARHRRLSTIYAALVARATDDHAPLIAAAGAEDLIRRTGYRSLFRDGRAFDSALIKAAQMQADYGILFRAEDGAALAVAEPALRQRLTGALWWADAWSCRDPGALVKAYAALFQFWGGTLTRADILAIDQDGAGWAVHTSNDRLGAAQLVVATGFWSPALLAPLGYRIRMVGKRGYHMHFALPSDRAPQTPLLDPSVGAVYAPMQAGLRIATGADLSHGAPPAMPRQVLRARAAASDLLDLGAPVEDAAWSGMRPCMPDMLPLVGAAPRHPGLWFNFGHGHQGFTLGPTTGELLAALMDGDESPLAEGLSPMRRLVGG